MRLIDPQIQILLQGRLLHNLETSSISIKILCSPQKFYRKFINSHEYCQILRVLID